MLPEQGIILRSVSELPCQVRYIRFYGVIFSFLFSCPELVEGFFPFLHYVLMDMLPQGRESIAMIRED
jgi:hypothetical protein